jgi:tetratricopeptide (TPR) repeat protein
MSRAGLLQAALIIACIGLTAFLYFSPKTMLTPKVSSSKPVSSDFIFEAAKKKLQRQEATSLNELEKILETKTGNDRIPLLDSLAWRWDNLGEPAAAAEYYKKTAEINSSGKSWNDAADRYLAALRTQNDSVVSTWLLEQAIFCYNKVVEINPENVDAKMNLALCYSETSEPMKGIMMLREIVQKHPENDKAQMNLGFLSIRSGQFDKAVERFNKVIELNPSQSEAYYFLGYSLMQKGDSAKAAEAFKKYSESGKDAQLLKEANVYMNQLKTN